MSERKQRTAADMREKMTGHYGAELHHKHNRNHLIDPPHRPKLDDTLLIKPDNNMGADQPELHRGEKWRKLQRRLFKLNIH